MENLIRKAENRDIPEIMNLLHQVNDVHAEGRPDIFTKGHTKYNPEEVAEIISDPMNPIFVSVDDSNNVRGYCFCNIEVYPEGGHLTPHTTLYIDDLCVNRESRGQHVGKGLYEHVVGYAKEIGCMNVTLNVWSCNTAALKFYEKMGLKPLKMGMELLLNTPEDSTK